jgi:hypothetical protein
VGEGLDSRFEHLIPENSPLQLTEPQTINDRGEIAGNGLPPGCAPKDLGTCGHAFLLIPCDQDHPGVDGCDYSMAEESATATGSAMPTTITAKPELSPDAIRQLMQDAGRRSKLWYRGFGVPSPPK